MKTGCVPAGALAVVLLASCPGPAEAQAAAPQGTPLVAAPSAQVKPPPLTVGEKFTYSVGRGFGPFAAVSALAAAGYQQAMDSDRGYGQGAEGYFSRAGSKYGTTATRYVVGSFALASVFHQDPRYFRSGRRSFGERVGYALSRVVIARGDNGRAQFNISGVGGAMAAGLIANAWHEPPDRTIGRGFSRAGITLGMDAARNLFREFWPDIRRKLRK